MNEYPASHIPNNLLITGGTGSLAQKVVEILLKQYPDMFDKIMLYSRDEQKQEQMERKFRDYPYAHKLRFFIGDVRDKDRFKFAVKEATHIIHAAALKIVPSIEYNPIEAIKTNILGAQNLIEACAELHPYWSSTRQILAISTDKAVLPINLYGTTKLAAEKLFLEANNLSKFAEYSVARYGNVTNSRGSVIPLFQRCLEEKKPLTITDLRMTRFWITLNEAANFVIHRIWRFEKANVYIPEMRSYRIEDLAHVLLEDKYGATSETQHMMRVIGMRSGEKLHEDLISQYEFEYIHDQEYYYKISKVMNKDYADALRDARLGGLKVSNTYNSSMFVMSKEDLRKCLIDDGVIDPPFDAGAKEETPIQGGHA